MIDFKLRESRRLLFAAACCSLLLACAEEPVQQDAPPPFARRSAPASAAKGPAAARAEADARSALAALKAGDGKRSVAKLRRYLKESPRGALADDVRMALGQRNFEAQNFAAANADYAGISQDSPRAAEATLRVARCLVILRRNDDALRVLNGRSPSSDTNEQALEAQRIRYEAAVQTKRNLDALQALLVLSERAATPGERDRYRATAVDLVEARMTEDELRKVEASSDFGPMQANAKFRLGMMLLERKEAGAARSELQDCASIAGANEVGERARKQLDKMDAIQRVDAKAIGLVLPLSGKQAATGNKTLRGVQLALGAAGKHASNLKIVVADSQGDPEVAKRAVEKLVAENGVIAIIGGLLSKTADAEAAKAQELGVPAIMLSQKAGVTMAGEAIFRNAFTSQMQVQRLVEIAMNEMHLTRFAILFPNDAYGAEYANLFWDEVKARGGAIVGAQPYDPKSHDFRPYMQRLAGVYYLEDRAEEYKAALKKWQAKNPKRSARNSAPTFEDMVGPAADFEALFIPDRIDALNLIAPTLPLYDINDVRLLGTNLWNRPELVERKNKDIERAVFVDSFSASDASARNSEFFSSFRSAFNEEPGIFELQGYDSGLILRDIVGRGESSRVGVMHRLADLKNFPGALGSLSASEDREIQRPVVGLTVHDGKIEALESDSARH